MSRQPPAILRLSWGSVQTEVGTFRDAKLWPGGAREWDWKETDTHHRPGIQPADVKEVLAHGAQILVLGRGQQDRLQVMDQTLEVIKAHGACAEVLNSRAAVERYGQLAEQGAAVGALIHSTC